MNEPLLVSVPNSKEFWRVCKAAQHGEAWAVNEMRACWSEHENVAIECFLCGQEAEWPISSMACPDRRHPHKILLLPLCCVCEGLTFQQKWHSAGKILCHMRPGVRLYWQPTR